MLHANANGRFTMFNACPRLSVSLQAVITHKLPVNPPSLVHYWLSVYV